MPPACSIFLAFSSLPHARIPSAAHTTSCTCVRVWGLGFMQQGFVLGAPPPCTGACDPSALCRGRTLRQHRAHIPDHAQTQTETETETETDTETYHADNPGHANIASEQSAGGKGGGGDAARAGLKGSGICHLFRSDIEPEDLYEEGNHALSS